MTAIKVSARALMASLIWPLLLTPALAQESAARADADSGARFQLTGVLVSGSFRSALVNSSVYREGDRVAGAEILAIREGEVQLLVGSGELTIREGAVLPIPDDDALHQRAPAIATAEVVRHMESWRLDHRRPLQSASADDYVNPPRQALLPPSNGVLLSMTSSE